MGPMGILMQLGLGVWGLFMVGAILTTLLLVTAGTMEEGGVARGYRQVNAQCSASRPVYTGPTRSIRHAPPVKIGTPVRPEPARVPEPAPVKLLRLRKIGPEESQRPRPGFLVLNWPVRNPAEPIERK